MKARPEDLADVAGVNARFIAEVERFGLRFRCSACAHVAGTAARPICSLGYPNPMLRGPWRAIGDDGRVTFCKYFELGEGELSDPVTAE